MQGFDSLTPNQKKVLYAKTNDLNNEKSNLSKSQSGIKALLSKITDLQSCVLKLPYSDTLFSRKIEVTSSSSSPSIKVNATSQTPVGMYSIDVKQKATCSYIEGVKGITEPLAKLSEIYDLLIKNIPFLTKVTEGFCTIGGKKITIDPESSLQVICDQIEQQTNSIKLIYNETLDHFILSSNTTIRLRTAGDTSNFLEVTQLSFNNSNRIESKNRLHKIDLKSKLKDACLKSPIDQSGVFSINTIEFSYDIDIHTMEDILKMIHDSKACADISYDVELDCFKIKSTQSGPLDIVLEDTNGNFLEALGLLNSEVTLGEFSVFQLQDHPQIEFYSNKIDSLGSLNHLSIEAIGLGESTIQVTVDSEKTISKIEEEFFKKYNDLQLFIKNQTESKVIENKVVKAPLSASPALNLSNELRKTVSRVGLEHNDFDGSIKRLDQIGMDFSDDILMFKNKNKFIDKLSEKPEDVLKLIQDVSKKMSELIERYTNKEKNKEGALIAYSNTLDKQVKGNEEDIKNEDKRINDMNEKSKENGIAIDKASQEMNRYAGMFPAGSIIPKSN